MFGWCSGTKSRNRFIGLYSMVSIHHTFLSHVFKVYSVHEVRHDFSAGLVLTDLGAAALVACDTAEALRLLYKDALDSLQSCAFSEWASRKQPKGGVVRHFRSRLSSLLTSTGIRSPLVVEANA